MQIFTKGQPLTSRTLKLAGLLAMASAFLTLPLVYLSSLLESSGTANAPAIRTVIQVAGSVLFALIVLYLKKFLNSRCNFHDTDRSIVLLLITSIVTGVLSIGALYHLPLKEPIGSVVMVLLVVQGIVQLQFGYKLRKLPDDLGGLRKPFCYANMATGVLLASVVFMALSILVSAISDLMLGTIFFHMSRLAREGYLQRG